MRAKFRINVEAQMTNDELSSNSRMISLQSESFFSSFGFRHSFELRHSAFVI